MSGGLPHIGVGVGVGEIFIAQRPDITPQFRRLSDQGPRFRCFGFETLTVYGGAVPDKRDELLALEIAMTQARVMRARQRRKNGNDHRSSTERVTHRVVSLA